MNVKDGIAALVNLYIMQQSLDEEIKEIKSELKESGHNPAVIASVAKSVTMGKTDELAEKSQEVLDTVEIARS